MFLKIQRYTTSTSSMLLPVLISDDEIISISEETAKINSSFQYKTRIDLAEQRTSIYSPSSINTIYNLLPHADLTSGPGTNTSCSGDPATIDILNPYVSYPLIKLPIILNQTTTQLKTIIFNSNYLIYAEPVIVFDKRLNSEIEATTIKIKYDYQSKSIITSLTINDLSLAFNAIEIPI